MGYFPRPASPRSFWRDLKAYVSEENRFRLAGAAIAVGMTSLIITGFIVESRWGVLPEGPQLIYASDWTDKRTDAEIVAQQKNDQKALNAAREARRQEWQRLDESLKKAGL